MKKLLAAEFKHKVYLAITLTHVAEYLLIGLGAFFIVVAIVLLLISVSVKVSFNFEMCIQVRK